MAPGYSNDNRGSGSGSGSGSGVGGGFNSNFSKAQQIFCSIGHYAPMTEFSKKANSEYQEAKRRGRTCKVTCKRHTGGNVQELVCQDCGEIKPVDAFSNASRKASNTPRCRDCVSWTEADTTTANPLPAPLEDRAPDETNLQQNPGDELDDWEKDVSRRLSEGALYENATDVSRVGASAVDCGNGQALTSSALDCHNDGTLDVNHGRGAFNPSSAPSARSNVASTADTDHPRPTNGKQYTAYGPNGQVQQREQSVISTSDMTSVANTGMTAAQNSSGFAKVGGRKAPVVVPGYLTKSRLDEPRRYYRFDDDSGSEDEC